MNSSDKDLIEELHEISRQTKTSPKLLLAIARQVAEGNMRSAPGYAPMRVRITDSYQYPEDDGSFNPPDWVSAVLPHGSRFEKLEWEDGVTIVRLLNDEIRVVAYSELA